MLRTTYCLVLATVVAGCTDGGGESTAESTVSGTAQYRDSATAHDGTNKEPAAPPAQEASLKILIKGQGEIPQVDPQCALDPAGRFEGRYSGTFDLDDDGAYAAAIASSTAQLVTPSGCEIPNLTVGVVTDIVVRAELDTTTQNCETYCEAHARAEAEEACGATAASAQCRTSAEAQTKASCQTTCTTERQKIVAEMSLAANALGELDANALRAAAFGDFTANLTFDRME